MNKLVQKFGNEKRWVAWKLVTKDGKPTKVPFTVEGKLASSTNPASWSLYNDVAKASRGSGVGIVFTPDQTLLGIDIDHCIDANTGLITHPEKITIEKFLAEANTYTEVSPSKTGLHIFLQTTEPVALSAHKYAPYEVYSSGRYFTFTGRTFKTEEIDGDKEVRTVTPDEASALLQIIGYPWRKEEFTPPVTHPTVPTNLDDTTVLGKMFDSKNGRTLRELYSGNITKYKNDESRADAALLAHLAFWTGRDAMQMERIWVSSPLGAREKTQERKDYRDRSIVQAINKCKIIYEPDRTKRELAAGATEIQFLTLTKFTAQGPETTIVQNTENICRVLRDHPDFHEKMRYDIFRNTLEVRPGTSNRWRLMEDNDSVEVQTKISILYPAFIKVGKDMVYDAMIKVAKENVFDSAADFIRSLKWDGKNRLNSWLTSTYGCPDDVYHRAVGSNWIKGLVKRIVEPGCKFDFVLVLEGPQGSMKSTSLAVLGGQWHVETTMSTESKDFFMMFQGKAIIEFSEGETLSRTEVKRMKAIITTQIDKYRPPYERVSQDFPRRCVFAMTTNQEEYLKDETGNRRWLPVRLVKDQADVEWLRDNREQIFAEAYHRLTALHETIYDFPREETLAAQQARRIEDPNTDAVYEWYMKTLSDDQRKDGVTVSDVFYAIFNKDSAKRPLERYNEMVISTILKEGLGLTKKRSMRGGRQAWRYYNDNALLKPVDEIEEFINNPKQE